MSERFERKRRAVVDGILSRDDGTAFEIAEYYAGAGAGSEQWRALLVAVWCGNAEAAQAALNAAIDRCAEWRAENERD